MNYKKILTGIAAAAAVALGFTACSEDVEVNNNTNVSDGFSIGVAVHQGWNDTEKTRAARHIARINEMQAAGVERVITTEGTIEGEPIYMWCDEMDGIDGKDQPVMIEAPEQSDDETTRGTLMNGHDGSESFTKDNFVKSTFYSNFNIYGAKAADGTVATWKHDNEWTVSPKFTWTDDNSYTFYAIAPANAADVPNPSATGFSYTTPEISTDQKDIMVGTASAKRTDRHMLFKFNHVFSAIKFKLGNEFASGYTITKLELMNINQKGTYTFSSGSWSSLNTPFTAEVTTNFKTTGGANKMITDDGINEDGSLKSTAGTTFLVLPQTLEDNVFAVVELKKDDEPTADPKYLNAQLKPLTPSWQAGYTYTYVISSDIYPSNYKFEVTQNPEFTWNGSTTSTNSDLFQVKSYLQDGGTVTPKAWTVVGYMVSEPGGTFPADAQWESEMPRILTNVPEGGSGTGTTSATESKTVAVRRQNPTETERQQIELRDPTRPVKENLDLSLYKVDNDTPWPDGRTTANSYIVRYGGTYKIPLVMGNTITKGSLYVPEAHSCADGSGWFKVSTNKKKGGTGADKNNLIFDKEVSGNFYFGKQTFVDYKNDLVSASNYKVDATDAFVIWHDFQYTDSNYGDEGAEMKVIKDVAITTEGADGLVEKFVTFRVDEELIQQGNAVIAVKNGAGKITWSWHIYVTFDNWVTAVTEVENHGGTHTFKLANSNLGYVAKSNRGTYNFPVRKIKLLVQQAESGQLQEVVITQNSGSENRSQNYDWDTKYQWGRKDALPGTGFGGSSEGGSGDWQWNPRLKFGCNFFTADGYSYERAAKKSATQNWNYGESIQYPLRRLNGATSSDMDLPTGIWSNKMYINAWSATKNVLQTAGAKTGYGHDPDGSDNFVIGSVDDETAHEHKTIYDPCPPGFKMPPSGAFTNFTTDGTNGGTRNISGSFTNPSNTNSTGKGYSFYAKGTSGATIYFPATGRLQDNGLNGWNTRGWVWAATPSVAHDTYYGEEDSRNLYSGVVGSCGVHLSFTSSVVNPLYNNTQNMPQSVRPMVDDFIE